MPNTDIVRGKQQQKQPHQRMIKVNIETNAVDDAKRCRVIEFKDAGLQREVGRLKEIDLPSAFETNLHTDDPMGRNGTAGKDLKKRESETNLVGDKERRRGKEEVGKREDSGNWQKEGGSKRESGTNERGPLGEAKARSGKKTDFKGQKTKMETAAITAKTTATTTATTTTATVYQRPKLASNA